VVLSISTAEKETCRLESREHFCFRAMSSNLRLDYIFLFDLQTASQDWKKEAIALRHTSERREETAMRKNSRTKAHPLQMLQLHMC
jgi:hypothetical protein